MVWTMGIKKKYVSIGAPLWMSQFTAVMLILIVFFMILCTMAKDQSSGFKSGDGSGKIRQLNALGLDIGRGTFRFGNHGKAKTYAPNPGSTPEQGPPGVHIDLTKGGGGDGNTDLALDRQQDVRYLSLPIRSEFPKGSASLTDQLKKDAQSLAIALSSETEPIIVKSFASGGVPEKNAALALARAEAVAAEFIKFGGIPAEKIKCVGYSGYRYLGKSALKAFPANLEQFTLIRLSVVTEK